eukprot:s1582_g1.t1
MRCGLDACILQGEGSGLWKHVLREGSGEPPPQHSRVNLHYSTYLIDGRRVDTSREGKRSMPCAFQLGRQDQGVEAWQLAAQTMSCGEVAWLQCPTRYAYGSQGAPNIPADADVWFCLELTSTKAPGTVRFLSRVADALAEAEKHMEVGRADIKRQAFAQARQAFRRAVAAEIITRFAKMERASLLNQAHCCLKLGDSVPDVKSEQQAHFREALQACRSLFDRHGSRDVHAEGGSLPETMVQVADAICKASQLEEVPWMAKAHFRRGLAKEKLRYLTDAVADYEAALSLEPTDSVIAKQLQLVKARKQKAELKPTQMFAGILQRERAEREREPSNLLQPVAIVVLGGKLLRTWQQGNSVGRSAYNEKRSNARPRSLVRPQRPEFRVAQPCELLRRPPEGGHQVLAAPSTAPESRRTPRSLLLISAEDAANYFWRLALEMVAAPAPSDLGPAEALRRNEALAANFWELRRRADIYYAYSYIHSYIQEPFTTLLPEHVFNCALYLWNILASSGFSAQPVQSLLAQVQGGPEAEAAYLEKVRMDAAQGGAQQSRGHLKEVPLGISRVYILYALAKQAQSLGACRLARTAYDKLQVLRVPPSWHHQIDLAHLAIRSKPYSDQDDLLPVCNWCMTTNPLLRSNLDSCTNCGHPFIRTFLGFDILPLVEFQPETDIALEEAQDLIEQEPHARKSQNSDGWHESTRGGAEVMSLSEGPMPGDEAGTDLFVQKMLDAASYFVPGEPVSYKGVGYLNRILVYA